MKKIIICLVVGLLAAASAASAQPNYQAVIGADVHVSNLAFNHLFDNSGEGAQIKLWELVIHGKLNPTPDLMLLFTHALGTALKANNPDFTEGAYVSTNYTQGALLYQFYAIDAMSVHAGLGYHFTHGHLKGLVEQQEQLIDNVYLEGSGFMASSHVTFNLMDNLEVKALIQAAPWYSWTFRKQGKDYNAGGSAYNYLLTADYSFKDNLVLRIGLGGSRSAVDAFMVDDDYKIEPTTFKQGGLQIGVAYRF